MCNHSDLSSCRVKFGRSNPVYGLTMDGQHCWLCCVGCKEAESTTDPSQPFQYWIQQYNSVMNRHMELQHQCLRSTHSGNGAPTGPFAFTLTKSPKDELTEEDMVCAVRKIMGQKSCPVNKYAWYLEYGDYETKTHPHIHGMYETATGGRIETKHWKRYWKIWDPSVRMGEGFRGGYHRPVRLDENYQQYIKKDNPRIKIGDNNIGDSITNGDNH